MTPDEYIPTEEPVRYEDEAPQSQYLDPHESEEELERGFLESIEDDFWSLPWLWNNIRFIIYCLFLGFVMIAWPYIYQGSLREITTLEKKLEDIRYKALFTSAALIEYERINNITTKVEQYQLQLVPATQPPYLLVDSGQYPTPQPR